MPLSPLALYPKILAISRQMAALAKAEDWDTLVACERERAALIAQLPNPIPALSGDEGQQLAELIRAVMAEDAKVREHVEPWLKDAAQLLPALAKNA